MPLTCLLLITKLQIAPPPRAADVVRDRLLRATAHIWSSFHQGPPNPFTCGYSSRSSFVAHQQTTVRPRRRPSALSPSAQEAILLASHLSNRPHGEGRQPVYQRKHTKLYLPLTYQARPQASDPDHPRQPSPTKAESGERPSHGNLSKEHRAEKSPPPTNPAPRQAPPVVYLPRGNQLPRSPQIRLSGPDCLPPQRYITRYPPPGRGATHADPREDAEKNAPLVLRSRRTAASARTRRPPRAPATPNHIYI